MYDYIYDGSFDGLLTVIWHHYYTDRAAGICTEDRYQPSFLQDSFVVRTDRLKADRVYQAIRRKISEYDLRAVYRAYLSCDPEKEMKILRYVVLGFREGHRTSSLHAHPVVADLQAILKKISHEQERMMQFVRFSVIETGKPLTPAVQSQQEQQIPVEMQHPDRQQFSAEAQSPEKQQIRTAAAHSDVYSGILYARVEPDNDVIGLAAPHFCDRFHNDSFIIHDVGRNKAIIASKGRWIISAFAPEDVPKPSQKERSFRGLWKQYFDHIAILERTNTRCQNNFIPDRYRKHLTEIITQD